MNHRLIRELLSTLLLRIVAAVVIVVVVTAAIASAQCCSPDQCDECDLNSVSTHCCHEPPELWVVNTRCAPRCANDYGFHRIRLQRYDACSGCFVNESLESFLACEATMPTVLYAHGNGLSHEQAMKACWWLRDKMRCCAGKKRLVFWSWPAKGTNRGLRVRKVLLANLRQSLGGAEYQGYYMAKLVDQMSLSQRVMLSGHSYGAATAAAAAHYLGGGYLQGRTLEGAAPVMRPNLRTAIISGAFDCDHMYPGHRYGQSFVASEKVWITRNARDRTLSLWPRVSYRCQLAIGVTGVSPARLGQYSDRLCQQTSWPEVRRQHRFKAYLGNPRVVAALCCLAIPKQCCDPPALVPVESADELQLTPSEPAAEPADEPIADTTVDGKADALNADARQGASTQLDVVELGTSASRVIARLAMNYHAAYGNAWQRSMPLAVASLQKVAATTERADEPAPVQPTVQRERSAPRPQVSHHRAPRGRRIVRPLRGTRRGRFRR